MVKQIAKILGGANVAGLASIARAHMGDDKFHAHIIDQIKKDFAEKVKENPDITVGELIATHIPEFTKILHEVNITDTMIEAFAKEAKGELE